MKQLFFFLFALLLIGCTENDADINNEDQKTTTHIDNTTTYPPAEEEVLDTMSRNQREWLNFYSIRYPEMDIKGFAKVDEYTVDSFPTETNISVSEVFLPYMKKNEDDTKALDWLSYEREMKIDAHTGTRKLIAGSPDQAVFLVNLNNNTRKRLLFCGTPCSFESVDWVNSSEVIISGLYNFNGKASQPTIWNINLKKKRVIVYQHPQPVAKVDTPYQEYLLNRY